MTSTNDLCVHCGKRIRPAKISFWWIHEDTNTVECSPMKRATPQENPDVDRRG